MKKSIFTLLIIFISIINVFAQNWQNKIDTRLKVFDGTTEQFEFFPFGRFKKVHN